MKIVSYSPEETREFAPKILKELKGKNVVALYGELGAGKTTFIQGLAKALGISKRILSPTYILMRIYKIDKHPIYNSMVHLDFYRLKSSRDLKSIELDEVTANPQNLLVVEWADKAREALPASRIDLKFKIKGKQAREIEIIPND